MFVSVYAVNCFFLVVVAAFILTFVFFFLLGIRRLKNQHYVIITTNGIKVVYECEK